MGILANFIVAVAFVINAALTVYFWVVIIAVLLSWVNPNPYNPIVRILRSLTEPVFYRIRRLMPFTMVGGMDLSPVVLLLGIWLAEIFIVKTLYQLAFSAASF